VSNNSFLSKISAQFDVQMNAREWRVDTFNQLSKDFQLSGVPIDGVSEDYFLSEIIQVVSRAIQKVKSNKQQWDNLNYRIDVPTNIDIESLSNDELGRLFLFRCFQKVWIRKHYSNSIAKDEPNDSQEHLKP
jgi:hypothetical protein